MTPAEMFARSKATHDECRFTAIRSPKILDCHLRRMAVVYVRQSSPQQVLDHPESRARQYALANHAVALGWSKDRVAIIDEDQGQSGKTAEGRSGFHRLLGEVTMDHVGLVLGLEMSRLARSSKDWHQLLDLCGLFGTILADEDGVYDPQDSNDRLLLGLKGTISEFELVTMRNRLLRGRLNKAQRGELFHSVPSGYVKVSSDHVELDPDEQVRSVVRLIFDKYEELGTARAVFRYLLQHDIRLGIRPLGGPNRGQLEWRRPRLPTLHAMLHHPMYAGAYVYGRRMRDHKSCASGQGKVVIRVLPREQWKVLKQDAVPAYITWERYLANLDRLRQCQNSPKTRGAPRHGEALLAGLIVCGTCGRRLQTSYHYSVGYWCNRHQYEGTPKVCGGIKARVVDDLVAQQVLKALEPAALQLSFQVVADLENERVRLEKQWEQRRERVRFQAQEAERRYRAVDPENRLVARTLEECWEEALREDRQTQEAYDRFLSKELLPLSREERARIERLSADIPALWKAPETTAKDRKEIIRLLIERVVVHVKKKSEYADVEVHWQGGFTSRHEVVRPVQGFEQLRDYNSLMDRIVELRRAGHSASQIAETLNREGYKSPRQRARFSKESVRKLLSRRGLSNDRLAANALAPDEWWLPRLAKEIGVAHYTLRHWAKRRWVHWRRTMGQRLWVVWADAQEIGRLRKLAVLTHSPSQKNYPTALTTPKKRPRRCHEARARQAN